MLIRSLVAAAALLFSASALPQEPIRIGAFLAVTGPARWLVSLLGAILLIVVVRALGLFRPRTV